jgi:hypothetical protein
MKYLNIILTVVAFLLFCLVWTMQNISHTLLLGYLNDKHYTEESLKPNPVTSTPSQP